MARHRYIPAALLGACLAQLATAQTTYTQRLEFDDEVVHSDPVGLNFDAAPALASQIISAHVMIRANQASIADEADVRDSLLWVPIGVLAGTGWQKYSFPIDPSQYERVSAGLEARLLVNYTFSYLGTQIDYAELQVVYNACPADFDANGFVNGDDYDAFATAFDVADPAADLDRNGFVNGDDYDLFASAFDQGC